mmetsp:Transcript_50636/g.119825  ORF Transcript_50636/g.119825 Transcript_50636/m.119825 type:complete len:213 (+) Transcript_50636:972-1610(+)
MGWRGPRTDPTIRVRSSSSVDPAPRRLTIWFIAYSSFCIRVRVSLRSCEQSSTQSATPLAISTRRSGICCSTTAVPWRTKAKMMASVRSTLLHRTRTMMGELSRSVSMCTHGDIRSKNCSAQCATVSRISLFAAWRCRARWSRIAETNDANRRSLKGGFAISFISSPKSAATSRVWTSNARRPDSRKSPHFSTASWHAAWRECFCVTHRSAS